jgi:glutamate dehydrogenase (NAD(P)+)
LNDAKGFDLEAVLGCSRISRSKRKSIHSRSSSPSATCSCEGSNAGALKGRIIAEGTNGPTTPDADSVIEARGDIFVMPDSLCNAGGVIVIG